MKAITRQRLQKRKRKIERRLAQPIAHCVPYEACQDTGQHGGLMKIDECDFCRGMGFDLSELGVKMIYKAETA